MVNTRENVQYNKIIYIIYYRSDQYNIITLSDRFFLYIFIQFNVHIACLQGVIGPVPTLQVTRENMKAKILRRKKIILYDSQTIYYYCSNFVQAKTRTVKWTSRTHNIIYRCQKYPSGIDDGAVYWVYIVYCQMCRKI